MRRLILVAVVASLAIMASLASVAAAATAQACYTFTRVNPTNDAVISMVTQPVPFVAAYDGGSATVSSDTLAISIINATNEPGVFYSGFVAGLNRSTIGFDFTGVGNDKPSVNYSPGYAKYKIKSAGNCANPAAPPQVNRTAYCANTPVARVTGGPGLFQDLVTGQTMVGVTLTPAIYVQDFGLMCFISDVFSFGGNPAGFHSAGYNVGGGGDRDPGSGYPFWAKN